MKKIIFAVLSVSLCFAVSAAQEWAPGRGLANEPARGSANIEFSVRDNDHGYGWNQYNLPVGVTVLPWAIPNCESSVYGLRLDFGWGKYENTWGLGTGLFCRSADFRGLSVTAFGNWSVESSGIQAGLANVADIQNGLFIGLVNATGRLRGVQLGFLNFNAAGLPCFPLINAGW